MLQEVSIQRRRIDYQPFDSHSILASTSIDIAYLARASNNNLISIVSVNANEGTVGGVWSKLLVQVALFYKKKPIADTFPLADVIVVRSL